MELGRNIAFAKEFAGLLLVNYRSRELCVVIHANVAQFLCDIPSNLPLCGGSERLCKITASHAKDGVMQSVTIVDGHCVRHVRRAVWVAMCMAGTLNVSNEAQAAACSAGLVFGGTQERVGRCQAPAQM